MAKEEKYIVAAAVNTEYKDCIVAPEGAMIMATHRKVYGPAAKEKCEKWKRKHSK